MHIIIINNNNYQYIILGSAQFLLFFLEINNFIQQGCIKLIKHVRNYVKTIQIFFFLLLHNCQHWI